MVFIGRLSEDRPSIANCHSPFPLGHVNLKACQPQRAGDLQPSPSKGEDETAIVVSLIRQL
jgi:hypothetical protein